MRGRRLEEDPKALNVDADHLGDGATAVATEHVARPYRVFFAGVVVLNSRSDAVAVLLQRNEFMVKPDFAGIEFLGPRLHKRFEPDLRKIGAAAGAGLHPIEIFVSATPGLDPGDLPADIRVRPVKAGVPAHVAHVFGAGALLIDLFGDADVAENLHRALV